MTPWKSIILALKVHGLSEAAIAEQCGCGQSTISYLLHERLADPRYLVGVALHELLERAGKARAVKRRTQKVLVVKSSKQAHALILPVPI